MPTKDVKNRTYKSMPVYYENWSVLSGPAEFRLEKRYKDKDDVSHIVLVKDKKGMYDYSGHWVKEPKTENRPVLLNKDGEFIPFPRETAADESFYYFLFSRANPRPRIKIHRYNKYRYNPSDGEGIINYIRDDVWYV